MSRQQESFYLVVGATAPGEAEDCLWTGLANSPEAAQAIWTKAAWAMQGLTAEEIERAIEDGCEPYCTHVFVSDSPIEEV